MSQIDVKQVWQHKECNVKLKVLNIMQRRVNNMLMYQVRLSIEGMILFQGLCYEDQILSNYECIYTPQSLESS